MSSFEQTRVDLLKQLHELTEILAQRQRIDLQNVKELAKLDRSLTFILTNLWRDLKRVWNALVGGFLHHPVILDLIKNDQTPAIAYLHRMAIRLEEFYQGKKRLGGGFSSFRIIAQLLRRQSKITKIEEVRQLENQIRGEIEELHRYFQPYHNDFLTMIRQEDDSLFQLQGVGSNEPTYVLSNIVAGYVAFLTGVQRAAHVATEEAIMNVNNRIVQNLKFMSEWIARSPKDSLQRNVRLIVLPQVSGFESHRILQASSLKDLSRFYYDLQKRMMPFFDAKEELQTLIEEMEAFERDLISLVPSVGTSSGLLRTFLRQFHHDLNEIKKFVKQKVPKRTQQQTYAALARIIRMRKIPVYVGANTDRLPYGAVIHGVFSPNTSANVLLEVLNRGLARAATGEFGLLSFNVVTKNDQGGAYCQAGSFMFVFSPEINRRLCSPSLGPEITDVFMQYITEEHARLPGGLPAHLEEEVYFMTHTGERGFSDYGGGFGSWCEKNHTNSLHLLEQHGYDLADLPRGEQGLREGAVHWAILNAILFRQCFGSTWNGTCTPQQQQFIDHIFHDGLYGFRGIYFDDQKRCCQLAPTPEFFQRIYTGMNFSHVNQCLPWLEFIKQLVDLEVQVIPNLCKEEIMTLQKLGQLQKFQKLFPDYHI